MEGFAATGNPFYSCRKCRSPLALRDDLLSKSFVAKSGGAFLFRNAKNIVLGKTEDRQLLTGKFETADIYCSKCGEGLGWKYIRAYDPSQVYKEGRFILEKAKIFKVY
ncbi:OLC1v1020889C1 [Oldenlandia corymbosa var. corymbosa]|uniref:Protein yippee-like n=1 Tax=Oldenlandia corymbosa var. corymbosa TaxID=529605 RepID=A0AAV1BV45_OLDCO|nr:OLC1v1020889C1 [Oldenlandia corymbosa var. corymbosa]